MAPSVALVLITHYGTRFLGRVAESLAGLDYPADRRSLIVVDNGPAGEGGAWFAARDPRVTVIAPGGDTGYAGGAVLGMERALADGAAYVAVVSEDVVLDRGWLRELVAVAEAHPEAGVVQPKVLRRDAAGGTVINSWGNELHFTGVGYAGGDGQPDRPLGVRSIPYASGVAVLFRASWLRRVGLFDPAFFMYHEDSDLSWRLRLAGADVLLAPQAVVHHDYDFTRSPTKFYYIERNRLINVLTLYRVPTLLLLAPALFAFELAMLLYAWRTGWLSGRLAVYAFFARPSTWRYLRARRRATRALRRVPDRVVTAHFTGRIDFPHVGGRWLCVFNPLAAGYWAVARRLIAW